MKDWAREKVERVFIAGLEDGETFKRENWNLLDLNEAIRLLRAERARARRVVRQFKDKNSLGYVPNKYIYDVCDELLRRLK